MITMKKRLLTLLALVTVCISAMCQVTFTAIEGSDWTDAEGSAKAFDGNLNTKWCKGAKNEVDKCYLMLEASEATYIQGFKMTTANDNTVDHGRVPGEYTIFGSNDKTQWDVIYHQKEDNLIEDKNFTEYTVYCNSKQKYKYFKLWIKRNATRSYDLKNRLFQLSEFALLPAAFGMTLESGSAKAMDGDTGEKWEDFSKPKIVYMEIQTDNEKEGYPFPCFSYDNSNKIVLNTAYIISSNTEDVRFILGVINSKMGRFLTKLYVSQLQERQFRMLAQYVKNFPIPKLPQNEIDYIIKAVEYNINKCNSELEEKINRAVCSWYNLNADELNFIEQGAF